MLNTLNDDLCWLLDFALELNELDADPSGLEYLALELDIVNELETDLWGLGTLALELEDLKKVEEGLREVDRTELDIIVVIDILGNFSDNLLGMS